VAIAEHLQHLPAVTGMRSRQPLGLGGLLIIANPRAGRGRGAALLGELVRKLPSTSTSPRLVTTQAPGHAAQIAAEDETACEQILVVGGDGTLGEVATGLHAAGRLDTPIALIPAGTGNEVARTLGIRDLDTALQALCGGRLVAFDACRVRYAREPGTAPDELRVGLHWSGVGFPAEVIACITPTLRRWPGGLGFLAAAVRALAPYRCPRMRISADSRDREGPYLLCGVANLERAAGQALRVAPGARWDDGKFDVMLSAPVPLFGCLPQLARTLRGTHSKLPGIEYYPARRLRVESEPAARLLVDGEVIGYTPAEFEVMPGALRILVP
jgi:diacylglycerol kinase (ATP)